MILLVYCTFEATCLLKDKWQSVRTIEFPFSLAFFSSCWISKSFLWLNLNLLVFWKDNRCSLLDWTKDFRVFSVLLTYSCCCCWHIVVVVIVWTKKAKGMIHDRFLQLGFLSWVHNCQKSLFLLWRQLWVHPKNFKNLIFLNVTSFIL